MRRLMGVLVGLVVVGGARADVVLQRVEVARNPAPAVRLIVSGRVMPSAHSLAAEGDRPPRIYVDLPGTMLDRAMPATVSGAGAVARVRTAQFDATTVRVVLDLVDEAPFTLREDDGAITVALALPPHREPPPTPHVAPASPPPPAPRAEAAPARAPEPPPSPRPAPAVKPAPPAVTAKPVLPPPAAAAEPPPPPRPLAATPPPTLVPPARASAPRIVVLDAGHGGHDPGATIDGVYEKTITLDLARRVAARLADEAPVDVVLTREDDTYVSLPERTRRASDAAMFVSLHVNAAEDPGLNGVEIFYGGGGPQTVSTGPGSPLRLGLDVVSALGQRLPDVRTMMRPGPFSVIVHNSVPSVLVEVGYLTNPGDAAKLRDETYLERVASAIADAAAEFLREPVTLAARSADAGT